jgi:N-acetylglucosamine-6-sulfatase
MEEHGSDVQKDYLPKVLQRKAMDFLRNVTSDEKEQPFFLMLGTPSCHDPTEPAIEYADQLPDARAPRPPNYAAYFEDKHWFVAQQGNASGFGRGYEPIEEDYNDLQYRRRALTLMTVDDIIGNITELLEQKGLLDNTYIFHTADNGYHL